MLRDVDDYLREIELLKRLEGRGAVEDAKASVDVGGLTIMGFMNRPRGPLSYWQRPGAARRAPDPTAT